MSTLKMFFYTSHKMKCGRRCTDEEKCKSGNIPLEEPANIERSTLSTSVDLLCNGHSYKGCCTFLSNICPCMASLKAIQMFVKVLLHAVTPRLLIYLAHLALVHFTLRLVYETPLLRNSPPIFFLVQYSVLINFLIYCYGDKSSIPLI